ncbi:hypothetical protein D5S18_28840 [Nocardia panacis]|uniref:Uncharacterized protein n=1 Tax=Nocardia panacis TaxID=2340916 RepID=A0A3A4K1C4_9NOCA|nr:hypothetical protein D5S18_28840 [Nocardia panacis]
MGSGLFAVEAARDDPRMEKAMRYQRGSISSEIFSDELSDVRKFGILPVFGPLRCGPAIGS